MTSQKLFGATPIRDWLGRGPIAVLVYARRGQGSRSAAEDGGTDERRGLRQHRVLHRSDGEAGRADGIERGAVAVAAHDQPVPPGGEADRGRTASMNDRISRRPARGTGNQPD